MDRAGGLPISAQVHAVGALGLGFGLCFAPAMVMQNSFVTRLSQRFGIAYDPAPGSSTSHPKQELTTNEEKAHTNTGIMFFGIGAIYLGAYLLPVPWRANQYLYITVPVRLAVSALSAVTMLVRPKSRDWIKATFVVWDSIGALLLGWELGKFDGVAPALE